MSSFEEVQIGDCRLIRCDYRDVIGSLPMVDAVSVGTTCLECALEGRRFIGVEIDRSAFDIACERIDNAYRQAPMVFDAPRKQVQEELI